MKSLDDLAKAFSQAIIIYLTKRIDGMGEPSVTFNHYKHDLIRGIISGTKGQEAQIIALATKVKFEGVSEFLSELSGPMLKHANTALWAQVLGHLQEHYLTILEYEVAEGEAIITELRKIAYVPNSKLNLH